MSEGRQVVFTGTEEMCWEFIRANRFSVTIHSVSLRRHGHEWAVEAYVEGTVAEDKDAK